MRSRPVAISRRRSGFTLVEVLVAGVITALVVGSVAMSLGQLGRAKNTCRMRTRAYMRADAALNTMRRDIISILRSDDLFDTRLLLYDDAVATPFGEMDRDEILVFNVRLRPVRDTSNFNGEGAEYETQYRVEDDDLGPALWQRRDALPDEYLLAGGVATPLIEGVMGLGIEVFDGDQWQEEWDSDEQGLPHAVSLTVTVSGYRDPDDLYERAPIMLRTVVPIDRVFVPRDIYEALEEEEAEEAAAEGGEEAGELGGSAAPEDAGGGGGAVGGGGGGVPRRGGGGAGGGTRRGGGGTRGGGTGGGRDSGGGSGPGGNSTRGGGSLIPGSSGGGS